MYPIFKKTTNKQSTLGNHSDPLTWSLRPHSLVPGYTCTLPGSATCVHRRCDNEGLRRQYRWLDEEGSEDNTNPGQWLASRPGRKHTYKHTDSATLAVWGGTQETNRGRQITVCTDDKCQTFNVSLQNILDYDDRRKKESVCVCYTDCCTGEGRAAFTLTVYISEHTRTAGALIHLPLFVRVIYCSLVQTRNSRVYDTHTRSILRTSTTTDSRRTGWLWYLGIHSSISLESSLVSDRPDKWQVNTLQCCTQCSPAKENERIDYFRNRYFYLTPLQRGMCCFSSLN